MKLQRLTDYAALIMLRLARDWEEQTQASHTESEARPASLLARHVNINLPTASKVLKALLAAGLIESQRGIHGGYTLARAPDQISVADIIVAIEGPIALTSCVEDSDDECCLASLCVMQGSWEQVNRAVRNALTSITLCDLAPDYSRFTPFVQTPQFSESKL